MAIDIYQDPVGRAIKAKLMNYATTKYSDPVASIEASINNMAQIVAIVRDAIEDCLDAEIGCLSARGYVSPDDTEDKVPILFIAGLSHALDVIKGDHSLIGQK
jgi:hypothetical protein